MPQGERVEIRKVGSTDSPDHFMGGKEIMYDQDDPFPTQSAWRQRFALFKMLAPAILAIVALNLLGTAFLVWMLM